jgi:hypothetical protein
VSPRTRNEPRAKAIVALVLLRDELARELALVEPVALLHRKVIAV